MIAVPLQPQVAHFEPKIVAVLDFQPGRSAVAECASQLAEALDRPLVLFHAVEDNIGIASSPDPVEWDMRLQQGRSLLARVDRSLRPRDSEVRLELVSGSKSQALAGLAEGPDSIFVLGMENGRYADRSAMRTVHELLEAGAANVLLVPDDWTSGMLSRGEVMAPVDGSGFAETALAQAAQLARYLGRDLLLTHVVPELAPTSFGPPDPADLELRMRLSMRNESGASEFLERTRRRYGEQALIVRSLCLKGDVRTRLVDAIAERQPALVVISARGQGGNSCPDLPLGGIASYLVSHLTVPTLIVQPPMMRHAERESPVQVLRTHGPAPMS